MWTAVEPVAMAVCATAVNDGIVVTFCSATTPLRLNVPRPPFLRQHAGRQIALDEVGLGAVERDQQNLGRHGRLRGGKSLILVIGERRR